MTTEIECTKTKTAPLESKLKSELSSLTIDNRKILSREHLDMRKATIEECHGKYYRQN